MQVCAAGAITASTSACGKINSTEPARAIVVDREVTLPNFRGEPNAIARLPDGGFIVVGAAGAALAIVTDSAGQERWTYREPLDHSVSPQLQSAFLGAVPLTNGNILVCGYKLKGGRQSGVLLTFDGHGQVSEQQTGQIPFEDKTISSSYFYKCYPWDGGIAVVGNIIAGNRGYGWVIKLDGQGAKLSEHYFEHSKESPVTTKDGPSFVRVAYKGSTIDGLIVIRENAQGEVMASREIPGDHSLILSAVKATENTSILSYKMGKATLYTLDARLADAKSPVDIASFYTERGAGYVLADGSLALFGRTNNAAVAWISASGTKQSVFTFDPSHSAFVVSAALPISSNQFVTARMSDGDASHSSALTMAWITFK